MGQGIRKQFQDTLVQLHLGPGHLQLNRLAQLPSQIADHARELSEEVPHRLHTSLRDGALQLARQGIQSLHHRSHGRFARIERPQCLISHQHQFAGQGHQTIDQRHRDSHTGGLFRAARRDGARLATEQAAARSTAAASATA